MFTPSSFRVVSLALFAVVSCGDTEGTLGFAESNLVTSGYDTRLDDADVAIEKAIVLLQVAQNPESKKPFGGHVDKAIADLESAREEIAAAKEAAASAP